VVLLVEHVGGHDAVERAQVGRQGPPVEEPHGEAHGAVAVGVVPHRLQGVLLVVAGRGGEATAGGHDRGQADAAAEFQQREAGAVAGREVLGEHDGRLPDVRPVGNPLVALERLDVDQGVDVGGLPDRDRGPADVEAAFDRRKTFVAHGLLRAGGLPAGTSGTAVRRRRRKSRRV
jgi:hypothetical protein